jgi:hypothetical protein
VALQSGQIAYCKQGRTRETQGLSRRAAVARAETGEIHAIAQDPYPLGGNAELHEPLL